MNWFKDIIHIGVLPSDAFFDKRLKIAVNLLALNATVSLIFAALFGYYVQEDANSLLILLSVPVFLLIFYLNKIGKVMVGLTLMFMFSALLLTIYSLRTGEESATHLHFILNFLGLSLIYQKKEAKAWVIANLIFTLLCIVFVLLSYRMNWFAGFVDDYVIPEKQRILNFVMLIACSIVYSGVVVNTFNLQHKEIAHALEEQRVLLAEVNHRVKNNMAIIISLLNLKRNLTDNDKTKQDLNEIKDRVMSMALVHQKMYQNKNQSAVEIDEYVSELVHEIKSSVDMKNEIIVETEIEKVPLDVSMAIPLGLILNELITNSMKHAFDQTASPLIRIKLKRSNDRLVMLSVKDNGKGMDFSESPKEESLGMLLIEALTDQLGGDHNFSNNNGLEWMITFPLR